MPLRKSQKRTPIGLWSELPPGARWTNEGVSRVVGFLIEGASQTQRQTFRVIVPHGMAEVAAADLRSLAAVEGRDWTLHEAPVASLSEAARLADLAPRERQRHAAKAMAAFANEAIDVAGWVATFPFFRGALDLKAPLATLFPDALPFDFPQSWPGEQHWGAQGSWTLWREAAAEVMAASRSVITFSEHVAERHLAGLFGVPREKIHVAPLAPPDLQPLVPHLSGRTATDRSRAAAAALLRRHAAERGWRYLADFPFEEIPYVVVSTQDRGNKNIVLAARAIAHTLRRLFSDLKLIITAGLEFGADWTPLPGYVETAQLGRDVVSMRDLPRPAHAALLHCAAATVHPSFYEGIVGALPFYESISVGVPAILADGPHTAELLATAPEASAYVFDPYDAEALAERIAALIAGRKAHLAAQRTLYERLLASRTWGMVADDYANAATGGAPPTRAAA